MITGADIAYNLASYSLEYLVQLDGDGNLVPVLCTRVPSLENGDISKDGLRVTYHLRKGVQWHDGLPFTADDVVATWKQVMNPLNPVAIREGYDVITSIDEPDKWTAVLHLRHPYAPLPTRFLAGIQEGPVPVLPAHIIANLKDLVHSSLNSKPIGTGPFIVQSWERGGALIFTANPHYWRGEPKVRKIIFRGEPSQQTEFIGFQTREIDADFDAGSGDLPLYRTLRGMHVRESHTLRLLVMVMFAQSGPLREKAVRHALAYAVDRQGLLDKIFHGAGYVADEFLPTWSWAYTPDVPRYPYDPQRAAAMLDAAGWKVGADGIREKNGERLSLVLIGITGSDAGRALNLILQQSFKALGIEATIKNYQYGLVFDVSGPIRQGHYNIATYTYSVNFDPASLQDDGCDQFSPAGANESRLCDPEVDRLERQALSIYDRAKRKALYARIEQLRMDDLGTLPLAYRDRIGVITDDLQNYVPSRGIMPNWNAWQWSLR
jgi:peptide/nickel transport system substrate-binding protein